MWNTLLCLLPLFTVSLHAAAGDLRKLTKSKVSIDRYIDKYSGLDECTKAYLHEFRAGSRHSNAGDLEKELAANREELCEHCGGFDFQDVPDLVESFVANASLEDVLGYATLCEKVYDIRDERDAKRHLLIDHFQGYKLLQVLKRHIGEISGAILYDKGTHHVVIVFAGSKSGLDWLTNLTGVQFRSEEVFEGLAVHSGFAFQAATQLAQIYETLDGLLDRLEGQDREHALRVTVTGHSSGGALSSLLAYHIKKTLPQTVVENIFFGSPRTFSIDSSFKVESVLGLGQILQVANERDAFTTMPAHGTFRHIGIPVPLHSHWIADPTPMEAEKPNLGNAISGFFNHLGEGLESAAKHALSEGNIRLVEYHAMQTYLDTLPHQYPSFRDLVRRRAELLKRIRKDRSKHKKGRKVKHSKRIRAGLLAEISYVLDHEAKSERIEEYWGLLLAALESLDE